LRGNYDAEWMKNHLDPVIKPESRDDWYMDDPDPSNTTYQFWNRVEKSLQHSVEAMATRIDWVITTHLAHHKVLECKCGDLETHTKGKAIQKLLTDYVWVSLWLVMGFFASVLTLSIALNPVIVH
jgi:hypothetical protein